MFNFYYFHENDHNVENDRDTCDYWRTIAYECQYQVKGQGEVVSRLQSELKLAEKRLIDMEKVNKSEIRAVTTSLENAIASRKYAELRVVELEQLLEALKRDSAKRIEKLEANLSLANCNAHLQNKALQEKNQALTELLERKEEELKRQWQQLQNAEQSKSNLQNDWENAEKQINSLENKLNQMAADLENEKAKNNKFQQQSDTAKQANDFSPVHQNSTKQCGTLLSASKHGKIDVIESILNNQQKNGVNLVETQDENGNRPLLLAAQNGHVAAVHLLVTKFGADLEVRNKDGNTALMLATDAGYSETVKTLLDSGADVDAINGKMTAMAYATLRGNAAMVSILLSKNANVNGVLELAQQNRKGNIVQLLRRRGYRF